MKIFYFHYDTRALLGEGIADPSPAEKGAWLVPGNATPIAPPEPVAGKVAVFDGQTWALVDDNRGKWYDADGAEISIEKPGEPPPAGASRDPRPNAKRKLVAGAWVIDAELVKAAKLAEINRAFEAAAAQITAGYPYSEMLTWPIQESEALAWQADEFAATPYVDALAAARGIARVDLLTRAAAKVAAFRAASARLVGARQKYEDQVNAAEQLGDLGAIEAINPVFSLV